MCAYLSPNPYNVNRCDLDEMLLCRPQFDGHLRKLAEATDYRIRTMPQRFAREGQNYADCANVLLLSPFHGKNWYFKCGLPKYICRYWRVCPACCHQKRMIILRKFLPVYDSLEGDWGFITLSSKTVQVCSETYCDDLEYIWDAYRFGFEVMTDLGEFDAVFLVEEFEVISYWPVPKVQVHVHAVVLADEISLKKTQRLKGLVENYPGHVKVPQKWVVRKDLRNRIIHRLFHPRLRWMKLHEGEGIPFELSTRSFRIATETDFAGILGYLVKPIDWSKKYVEEWHRYCTADRKVRYSFNGNVDQIIESWHFFTSERDQHIYLGKAHHARTDFVGIPKRQRETKRHKQRIRFMLEDCNMDRVCGAPDVGQPLEFAAGCGDEPVTTGTTQIA